MWPFSKKPEPQPQPEKPTVPTRSGFFTTEAAPLSADPSRRLERITAAIRRTFKQPLPALSASAMDDAQMDQASSIKSPVWDGDGVPEAQLYWYASQGFIGYGMCAMLAQHWMIEKACSVPARDAIRVGYDLTAPGGEGLDSKVLAAIKAADKRMGINGQMREYVRMGRTFGIRIAIFRVSSTDPQYYEKPFNPDGVTPGSYRGITQVDPEWCTPEFVDKDLRDPTSPNFYRPTYWRINGRRYHRSHLAVFVPHPVADRLKPTYRYGGVSVPQRIYERVYCSERTANEAPQLAMTKRTTVLKTDGAAAVADEAKFVEKLLTWVGLRDNYGVKVIDMKEEDISQYDTALGDLDTTIMTQYQLVASAANVPATKLLGTTPKGFNATGEYEESNYHEELESIQTHDLTPLLDRHHMLLMRSEIAPKFKIAPFHVEVSWRPLDTPTAAEWAAINLQKAQAATAYAQVGAVDGVDIRQQLAKDTNSDFYGLQDDTTPDPVATDGAMLLGVDDAPVTQEDIDECIRMGNFVVKVSPEYNGRRIVVGGWAALQAAQQVGAEPVFEEVPDGHINEYT